VYESAEGQAHVLLHIRLSLYAARPSMMLEKCFPASKVGEPIASSFS